MKTELQGILDGVDLFELETMYDSRASFGQKAFYIEEGDNKVLFSYLTKVAYIQDGELVVLDDFIMSNTTVRHIREFALQNGFDAETKKQILEDYQVKAVA